MHATFDIIGSNAFVIGGFNGIGSGKIIRLRIENEIDLWFQWVTMKGSWEPKGYKILERRYGHASVVYDKSIYLFGGVVENDEK